MSNKSRVIVLLLSTPILAFVVVGGVMGGTASGQDSYPHLLVFKDVVSLILNNYVEEVDVTKVMTGALKGLADGLDADSAFLEPSDVRAIEAKLTPPGGDVGLTLTRQYYLRVVAARDGSAAARAGLRTGDYVRMIDGRPTRDLSVFDGARLLSGAPGTKVSLVVIRGNAADPHTVDLVREPAPKEAALASRMAATDVGYLRIPAFGSTTAAAVSRAAAGLSKQGATKLVIDLRQSAEGPLEAGIETARWFVASGTLAIRAGRGGAREEIKATARGDAIAMPVVLLVNAGTSGAAELFAAALAGNKRAELIGEPTHGRAGIQKLVRLPEGHGLWLTHASYLTPAGEAIHEKGLKPALDVEEPDVEFGAKPDPAKGDPILEKALEKLGVRKAA
ncbi:MAG: S41 family peptidase [Vicinamibacterales bacterium]